MAASSSITRILAMGSELVESGERFRVLNTTRILINATPISDLQQNFATFAVMPEIFGFFWLFGTDRQLAIVCPTD
jgi:hypothetical protein